MRWTYSCPRCRAMLNPHHTIMLVAEHEGQRLLAGFHPQPGNYEVYLPPGVDVEPGSRWRFDCPVCQEALVSDLSDDLCALDVQSDGDTHRIYFSRIAGERATFMITAEGLLKSYGIHTDRYLERLVHQKYMR